MRCHIHARRPAALAAALLIACSGLNSPSRKADAADYRVTLHADSALHYVPCPPGGFYCFASSPDSSTDGLALHINVDSGSASGTWQSIRLSGTAIRGSADSLHVMIDDVDFNTGCHAVWLDGTRSSAGMTGRFSLQFDCHGLRRWGRYTSGAPGS